MARPDFRSQAAQRLATERLGHTPALIDLLGPAWTSDGGEMRHIAVERISPNPEQPRQHFDLEALQDLAASIREHGILQPVLVRPRADGDYQLVAGERRWRAARLAGLAEIPAIVERIDDDTALEIAIIENLQREDISPLEEADMFERMTTEHGYSLRKLAQKLGKDKGYVENRLRLAGAPAEIRELVAERRDTLSHAYELLKVSDTRKRRRLAKQVASGELSLVKLRQRIEGRHGPEPAESPPDTAAPPQAAATPEASAPWEEVAATPEMGIPAEPLMEALATPAIGGPGAPEPEAGEGWTMGSGPGGVAAPLVQRELVAIPIEVDGPSHGAMDIDAATQHLSAAVAELADALKTDASLAEATATERQQFAKYLTLAKIKLENAIAVVRVSERRDALRRLPDERMEAADEAEPPTLSYAQRQI